MLSFKEYNNRNDVLEENIARKGAALLLAGRARKHGNDAVSHFKAAQTEFTKKGIESTNEQLQNLAKGLNEFCEGMISLRKQNGSLVGISTASSILNERTNAEIKKLLANKSLKN